MYLASKELVKAESTNVGSLVWSHVKSPVVILLSLAF